MPPVTLDRTDSGEAGLPRQFGMFLVLGLSLFVAFASVVLNELVVAAGVGLFVVGACLLRPDLFVLGLLAYVPFEEFLLKWVPRSVYGLFRFGPELLILILFSVKLSQRVLGSGRWKSSRLDLPVFCFLSVVFLSSLVNDVPAVVAVLGMKNLLRYLVLAYLVMHMGISKLFVRRVVHLILAVAAIQTIICVIQWIIGPAAFRFLNPPDVVVGGTTIRRMANLVTSGGKVTGTMARYNNLGAFMAFFALIAEGLWYRTRNPAYKRILPLLFVALLLSFSRMSWLGVYGGICLILLLEGKQKLVFYLIVPALATLFLLNLTSPVDWRKGEGSDSLRARYLGMISSGYVQKSLEHDRLYALFVTAPTILEKYPLFGIGPGTIGSEVTGGGTTMKGMYPQFSHARWLGLPEAQLQYTGDCGWVAILAQVGLLGFLAFAWIIVRMIAAAWTCFRWSDDAFIRGLGLGTIAALSAVVFQNMFSFNFTYRSMSIYFWVFGAFACELARSTAGAQRNSEMAHVSHEVTDF